MKLYIFLIYLLIEIIFSLKEETEEIVFSKGGITVSEEKVLINGTTVVIEKPGSYKVTGESDEGNIVIKSNSVKLNLEDLYLASKNAPIIITSNLKNVRIVNKKNTKLEQKTKYDGECAVIKIKKNSIVSIDNEDTFELIGECRDVIKGGSQTTIIFEKSNGDYIINSTKAAIDSDGLIEFKGGNYIINSKDGDAIKSSPGKSDPESLGIILINNGNFKIDCHNDGFTAKNNIIIKNGTFDIKTENGYKSKTFNKTGSAKGFKLSNNDTGCGIYIYGGEFHLNTADDAIRSNRDITILSGEFEIYTKDDAICSKADLVLGKKDAKDDDLKINIEQSYEALEGVTITIYSGKIKCKASDDAMNASGDKQEEIDKDNRKRNQTRNRNNTNTGGGGNRPNRNNTNPWPNNNNTNWNWPNSNWTWPNNNNSNWNWPNRNNSNWTWPNNNGSNWNWPGGNNGSNWNWPGGNNGSRRNDQWDDTAYWDEIRKTHESGPPNDRYIIRIFGGEIYIYTNSDGIDTNGHLYIHGGNINIYSVGSGGNEPIDLSGNFTLFNAEILGIGSGGVQFSHTPLKKGNQKYAFYSGKINKNQLLEIKDENDEVVKIGNITYSVNYIMYSSPKLNEDYHFYLTDIENNTTELQVEFGEPEKGEDDQDKYAIKKKNDNYNEEDDNINENDNIDDIEDNNNEEDKTDKKNESDNYSKYLNILILGINILLL